MEPEKEYQKIVDSLQFQEKTIIRKDLKKGYFIVVGEINRRDVLLKIIPKINIAGVAHFQKESLINDIIDKHNRNLNRPLIVAARVLGSGQNENFTWLIRRFYYGHSLANYRKTEGIVDLSLYGYDFIQKKYQRRGREIVTKIVSNLQSLKTIAKDCEEFDIDPMAFSKRFETDLENYNISEIENTLGLSLKKQLFFYNSWKKNYLSSPNIQACIGDLVPGNIIVKNDGGIVLADLEWFSFDNYTIDIAFLWLFLWRYPFWQKMLLNHCLHSEEDRINFHCSVIRQIIGCNWHQRFLKFAKQYKIEHPWLKYLRAAGEFNKIP